MPDLIVKAGVKDELDDMSVSTDVYAELDAFMAEKLREARNRAQENGRNTVLPRDI